LSPPPSMLGPGPLLGPAGTSLKPFVEGTVGNVCRGGAGALMLAILYSSHAAQEGPRNLCRA